MVTRSALGGGRIRRSPDFHAVRDHIKCTDINPVFVAEEKLFTNPFGAPSGLPAIVIKVADAFGALRTASRGTV